MCDILVASTNATADGSVIFGKNSDRHPNEAHQLVEVPRAQHPPGSVVKCTYMEVPQVEETYAVLLAKPHWIWGSEIGANEHGVTIGNEAVFTKLGYRKTPALTGMDLIRLALERSKSADEALEVITALLERHGQGGNCGYEGYELHYHNSFVLADPTGAWVLETAGPHWAAERVDGVRSISNRLTIGNAFDRCSPELISSAVDRGWCKGESDFHFANCYSQWLYSTLGAGQPRQRRTTKLLVSRGGEVDVPLVMSTMRDHGDDENFSPAKGVLGANVCMHASYGPVRTAHSVGTMVSHLRKDRQTHWLTGTSTPCTSVFKPVWLDGGLPEGIGLESKARYEEASLWWRHEMLQREIQRDYNTRMNTFREEQSQLEREFFKRETAAANASAERRAAVTQRCFDDAEEALDRWRAAVTDIPVERKVPRLFRTA